ncbi:phage tail protein [Lactobacillus sp. CC-MHH1034]|uniref:phage tail spike protein n=1 Tax=Agrilactobacillus fermenti TaxID=2586909 RepID=UPI001E2B6D7C|nr:phage tail spike protein [Agrilactobacillus fermenti]MCD2255781.1 phage tail protein [Agrilactobacillus fermenti]
MSTPLLLLDQHEKVFRRVPATYMKEFVETQIIRDAYTLQGTALIKDNYIEDFDKATYFAITDDTDDDSRFRVYYKQYAKSANDKTISFQGTYAPYVELAGYGFIEDKRPVLKELDYFLGLVFEGTRWSVRQVPDDIPNGTQNFYYVSRLDALKTIIDLFDIDVNFVYTIKNNQITGRYVDVYGTMGRDTGKRFAYGSKALTILREQSFLNLYTAVVPRGDGVQKKDESGKTTGGYTRKITINDIDWHVSDNDPVDKPKGQKYLELPDRTALFGYPDGTPKTLIKDYPGIKDPQDLMRAAYLDLQEMARPKIQFTSTITDIGNVKLGDAIVIVMPQYKFAYKTRIFKLQRNLLNNENTVAEFGDYIVKSAYQRAYEMLFRVQNLDDNMDDNMSGINDKVDENKGIQDTWNEGQEKWNDNQQDWNKLREEWEKRADGLIKQVQDDVASAQKDISDYIAGQDQLGEIVFLGKDFLPTRNQVYNIMARTNIDGGRGRLIFNSKGLGYYDGNMLVKTAITNDGRVYADYFIGKKIEGIDIIGARINGGIINGGEYFSTDSGGHAAHFNAATLDFGVGNSTSNINRRFSMDWMGMHFYSDQNSHLVGYIGVTQWIKDTARKGLAFNVSDDKDFMVWGFNVGGSYDEYSSDILLAKNPIGTLHAGFNLGVDMYANFHSIYDNYQQKSWVQFYSNGIALKTYNSEINALTDGSTGVKGSRFYVEGDFGVGGNKNALIPTRDGVRGFSAVESAEVYFEDFGSTTTDVNGIADVTIDDLFYDGANTDIEYYVFLQPHDFVSATVTSKNAHSFSIKTNMPNVAVDWRLTAKRRGYEQTRLPLQKMNNDKIEDFFGPKEVNNE